MPGFMSGIHVFFCGQDVDGRTSPGMTFVCDRSCWRSRTSIPDNRQQGVGPEPRAKAAGGGGRQRVGFLRVADQEQHLAPVRESYLALNRYAVGSRLADREVVRPRHYETPLLSTAFPMSALPRIATTERTCQHVSNVPKPDVLARLFLDRKWRATADEDGHYSLAIPL
jgi:hypothetical protein